MKNYQVKAIRRSSVFGKAGLALILFVCAAFSVHAQTIDSAQTGLWTHGATWSGGEVPALPQGARILGNHVVTLDAPAPEIDFVGVRADGLLVLTNNAHLKADTGNSNFIGSIIQHNGALRVLRFQQTAPSYTLHDGLLVAGAGDMFYLGSADHDSVFNQYGGQAVISNTIHIARFEDTRGTYTLHGGTLTMTQDIRIGTRVNTHGILHLKGGEAVFDGNTPKTLTVGLGSSGHTNAVGELWMGSVDGGGMLREAEGAAALALTVRNYADVEGILRGRGNIELSGNLINNGLVIADGWAGAAQDCTLDLRTVASVDRTLTTGAGHGWFAINRAKLQLPDLAFTAANSARAWGDTVTRNAEDLVLVNSLHIAFNDVTVDGSVSMALLSPDRSDVAVAPDGATLIGVWDLTAQDGLDFDSADLTLRYDDLAAVATGVDDWAGKLAVFRDSGSGWVRLTGVTLDAENHQLTVTGLDGFSQIAVAVFDPPAGTVLLVR